MNHVKTTAVIIKTVLTYKIRYTFRPMRPLLGEAVEKVVPFFVLLVTASRDDGLTGWNMKRISVNAVIYVMAVYAFDWIVCRRTELR
jgi:ABC-type uncharacterized transport system permease subunit